MKAAAFSLTLVFLLMLGVLGSAQAQLTEGTDAFQSTATVEVQTPDGATETLTLRGPTLVKRGKPGDADGDGLADQPTEIIQLELRGTSATLGGDVTLRAGAQHKLQPSRGMIEELEAGKTFPADSFFNVFARLETPVGKSENREPARVAAVITGVPPLGTPYKEFNVVFIFVIDQREVRIVLTKIIHIPDEDPPVPQKRDVKKALMTWAKLKSGASR